MKVISVVNYKGGVGKTTLTANLAAELAWRGYNILLIDCDSQCSLTFSFIDAENTWKDELQDQYTLKNFFDAILDEEEPIDLKNLIISPHKIGNKLTDRGNLHLISSHLELIDIDLDLASEISGSKRKYKRQYLTLHSKLSQELKAIEFAYGYDYVFIDCPPNFNIVTRSSIVASDYILIPSKPDYLSTLGIDYLERSVNKLIREYNEYAEENDEELINPKILGVIFTMVEFRNEQPIQAQQHYIQRTKNNGFKVWNQYIRDNKFLFSKSGETGIPVVLNNFSNPTHDRIKMELEDLVSQFLIEVNDE